MDYKKILDQAKKNSIGSEKIEEIKTTVKRVTATVLVVLTLVTTAVCATGCTKNYDEHIVNDYNLQYVLEAEDIMDKYGLDPTNHYDQDVYDNLEGVNSNNFVGFYSIMYMEESDKLLKSIGYENLDDFLTKNGYVDSLGNPSIEEWKQSTYDKIMSDYEEKQKESTSEEGVKTK